MIQVYKLKKLNSVLISEINIGVLLAIFTLTSFYLNFSSPWTSGGV
jgi:ribosomal protein S19